MQKVYMPIYKNYIHKLLENVDKTHIPNEIDLVLDSGAFKGIYMYGALLYVKELEHKKYTKVHRISGSSVGAMLGCFYILNKMELIERLYTDMRKEFNNTLHLDSVLNIIEREIHKMDKNTYKKLNDRIFINYMDISAKKEIIVSTFTSNDDLIDKLRKTTFIPIISNDELTYDNCTDAMCPHIFTERIIGNKILFINLWNFGGIQKFLNTFYDTNAVSRTFGGILDIHEFFLRNSPTKMCSYVNDWNVIHYSIYRLRELIWLITIFIIHTSLIISQYIPENIKTSIYANTMHSLFLKTFKDFTYCIMGA